ncbi:MAG: nucleotidyl transferase AbiEii/AbiGii toxin family protein, partial [Chloroflexi bacterium HGW-Chloroflexi-1]
MTTYQTGAAFRRALEDRLLAQSQQTTVSLVRLRKLVAFDRFLARLMQAQPDAWVLKGGLALQLRIGDRARTTKDMDVLLTLPRGEVQRALQGAVQLDLGDWFTFVIRPATDALPGPGEGGLRFFVTARLDGRVFESFHVDVGSGDPVIEPAEDLMTPPLLAFAGISPVTIPCYPLTQHLAEKMHAYVRPRATGESTRVKDLVDIILIAEHMAINGPALLKAIRATFSAQGAGEPP